MYSAIVVLTTCPDTASADRLARALVEQQLTACVNQLAPVASVYRWRGRVEQAHEVMLLIKTTRDRYPDVEAAVRAQHPYELPEIIAVPVVAGFGPYLRWIEDATRPSLLA